jgi:hypothetical protein
MMERITTSKADLINGGIVKIGFDRIEDALAAVAAGEVGVVLDEKTRESFKSQNWFDIANISTASHPRCRSGTGGLCCGPPRARSEQQGT